MSYQTPDGIVKKSHWRTVFEYEKSKGQQLRIAYQLTEAHLDPKNYQTMSVHECALAFQVNLIIKRFFHSKTCIIRFHFNADLDIS